MTNLTMQKGMNPQEAEPEQAKKEGQTKATLMRLLKNKAAVLGGIVLIVLIHRRPGCFCWIVTPLLIPVWCLLGNWTQTN